MFTVILMLLYGIAVGYHYAQKEYAPFNLRARKTTTPSLRENVEAKYDANREEETGEDNQPLVRLVGVDNFEEEQALSQQSPEPDTSTPFVIFDIERPTVPDLSPQARELAHRLINRFRRSRNNMATAEPFLRPLRALNVNGNSTDVTGASISLLT
ncbi:uncharacterized protein LOC135309833 isoform X2 [Plodia interpunctella]